MRTHDTTPGRNWYLTARPSLMRRMVLVALALALAATLG